MACLLDKNFMPTPAETKADPFSLDSLIAWLKTKNPATEYHYWDANNCLFAQYAKHIGAFDPSKHATPFHSLIGAFDRSMRARISFGEDQSFGGALIRALSYKASHPSDRGEG